MRTLLPSAVAATLVFLTSACGAGAEVTSDPTTTALAEPGTTESTTTGPGATEPGTTDPDVIESASTGSDVSTTSTSVSPSDEVVAVPDGATGPIIQGTTQVVEADCEGEIAYVLGDFNSVTLNGPCAGVEVAGETNSVTITGAAESITVDGSFNTVDLTGSGIGVVVTGDANVLALAGSFETLAITGDFNGVDVDTIDGINVDGATNTVTYESITGDSAPELSDASEFNSIGPRTE